MAGDTTFSVEVLTPEGEVFNGDVIMLSTRTVSGEIGVLANHIPVLAALQPNLLRLKISESETKEYAQSHGTLQVFANHAQVLLEEAIEPKDLDVTALQSEKEDAEERLKDPKIGDAAKKVAERDLERSSAFLALAGQE